MRNTVGKRIDGLSDVEREIVVHCGQCGDRCSIVVPLEGFYAWKRGELIQNALPNLTPSERELLISQTCDGCWGGLGGRERLEDRAQSMFDRLDDEAAF